jgi:hypothetical protein
MNGNANAVATYNVADFAVAARRFKISVLSPAELLAVVRVLDLDGKTQILCFQWSAGSEPAPANECGPPTTQC